MVYMLYEVKDIYIYIYIQIYPKTVFEYVVILLNIESVLEDTILCNYVYNILLFN